MSAGAVTPAPTRGFVVDTSKRGEVVSFYHAVYMASEGYQNRIGWTGVYNSLAAGAEGTVSAEFAGDVERRLNYFRAMSGVRADVRVNSGATVNIEPGDPWVPAAGTTKSAAAQRSALMIIRTFPGNGGLSHDPAPSADGWTAAAWNANHNGNLALGFFGPGALDAYFKEDVAGISAWNFDVGHRRWLLCQWCTDYATGDTPGSFIASTNRVRPPSNAFYVIPKPDELDFSIPPVFAAYPSAGYFPAPLNTPFWSLSYPGADFSAATVSVTDATTLAAVPVSVVSRQTGYGDNAIVWQVPAATAAKSVTADLVWNVRVSNIGGAGVPSQHVYQVTLMDPERLPETPRIVGGSAPSLAGAVYQVDGVPDADSMQAGLFLRTSAAWSEGAEDGSGSRVIDGSAGSYPFRAGIPGYVKSGAKAFRLTFPTRYDPFINGVPQQSFELGRELLPAAGAKLGFQFRRGLMTAASKLVVEYSADGGLDWTALGGPYSGLGGSGDAVFQSASLNLPATGGPIRVRFRYYLADSISALYAHEDQPALATGVFIDDISASGCDWLEPGATIAADAAGSFTFDATSAGRPLAGGQEWWLRGRAVFGGKAFPYGPATIVTPVGPLQLSGPARPPASGADYGFVADPAAVSYQLEVAVLGDDTPWTEGAESSPPPRISSLISGSYSVSSGLKGFRKSGLQAFRLALSSAADEEDLFTIEREVVPTVASNLEFWVRRGVMSAGNRLHAELSDDGGASWTSVWNLAGQKKPDKLLSLRRVPLAAWAGRAIKLRFAIRKDPAGSTLKWNAAKSGVFLDDITVTAPSAIRSSHLSEVAAEASSVRLDAASAGGPLLVGSGVRLRLRSVIGGVPGDWGPALTVSPVDAAPLLVAARIAVGGFDGWRASYPGHELSFEGDADRDGLADGVEYAFSLDPTDGRPVPDVLEWVGEGRMEISRLLPAERADLVYRAEWSERLGAWSAEGVEIRIEAGRIHASAPRGVGSRFMRWNVVER